jgi:hypothetical protein
MYASIVGKSNVFHLFIRVEGINVLDGRGYEFWRELCRHSNGQWHAPLQGGVGNGTIVVIVVLIADLDKERGISLEKIYIHFVYI